VRLARLADSQMADSGVNALAAALPQMLSLTTLHLGSTATRACLRVPGVWGSRTGGTVAVRAVRCGVRVHGRMWAVGCRVRGPVMVARLAGNAIGDSGVDALAAVLPQMPSLTTLYLSGTAPRARCGFLLLSLTHRWLIVSLRRALRRAGTLLDVSGGLYGWRGREACAARREPDRRLGRGCARSGAAEDAEPHDAPSLQYGHVCALVHVAYLSCSRTSWF
jgi:hypothetical protein